MHDLFDLQGEVAIVTGGCGQLGKEYVAVLQGAGALVAVVDIHIEEIPNALTVAADITNTEDVARAFTIITERLGTPTILINNAGIDIPPDAPATATGAFEDFPEDVWDAVLDSHLKGMLLMSQMFLSHIRTTGRQGSIINVSSTYGLVAPDQSLYDFRRRRGDIFFKPVAYSVAKSGVLNFTRWLAEYCGSTNIPVRVNTLVPGGVYNGQDQEFVREYERRTIMKRMAQRDEYNGAVLFLASHRASSYVTGSTLVVDGGWTAR